MEKSQTDEFGNCKKKDFRYFGLAVFGSIISQRRIGNLQIPKIIHKFSKWLSRATRDRSKFGLRTVGFSGGTGISLSLQEKLFNWVEMAAKLV